MAEMQRLGVPAERLAADRAARAAGAQVADPDAPELAAHLWPAVQLFGALRTQWEYRLVPVVRGDRELGMRSVRVGLNYNRIDRVARGMGITRRQADAAFRHLQVMEDEALKMLSARGTEK